MLERKTEKGISYTLVDYSSEKEKTVCIGRKSQTSFALFGNHHKRNGYYLDYKIIASEVVREEAKDYIETLLDENTFYVVCRRLVDEEFMIIPTLTKYNRFDLPEELIVVGSADTENTALEIKKRKDADLSQSLAKMKEKMAEETEADETTTATIA